MLCTCQDKISEVEVCDARSFNTTHVVTKMASQTHDSHVSTLEVKSDSSLTKHEPNDTLMVFSSLKLNALVAPYIVTALYIKLHCSYLNSAIFLERNKVHRIESIGQRVALYPLICVLPSLCADSTYAVYLLEVYLKPLSVVTSTHAPRPAMVESAMPGRQITVVICRGSELAICNPLVFQAKGYATLVC